MTSTPKTHNLKIQEYNLDELLGLFDLSSYQISLDQLKHAKKRVLMLHPDKSRLGPEYFLFYKQAFDILVQMYNQQNRQTQIITSENTKYKPLESTTDKSIHKQVNQTIQKMSTDDFHHRFNTLFEQNNMGKRVDPKQNEWFTQETPHYNLPASVSVNNLGQTIETIKQQQAAVIRYRGVQDMCSSSQMAGGNVYDDKDDDTASDYIESDPFSKLKYDDLRKVHKDQTVFAVSEQDFHKIPQYRTVNELQNARSSQAVTPMDEKRAKQMLDDRETHIRERGLQREYNAKLQSQQFQEKNKQVLASFLYLK